jgi:hypothetical protein
VHRWLDRRHAARAAQHPQPPIGTTPQET